MQATKEILAVWKQFDGFPMETLTKAWHQGGQRTVAQMIEHRAAYGTSGNCFDLALWLLHEFEQAGVEAYAVGTDMQSDRAHVAVAALDGQGSPYLCDLGDLWVQPVLIDPSRSAFSESVLGGFFPGAQVQVKAGPDSCEVSYFRQGGKWSSQVYELRKIPQEELLQAAERSQRLFRHALVEFRVPYRDEIAHWEFLDWESYLSTTEGLFPEEKLNTLEEWCERIHRRTGMAKEVLRASLTVYQNRME